MAAEVEELLRRAREVDEEEDRRYGQSRRGDELPEELSFREGRLEKIREAMASLEAEAEVAAEQAEAEGKDHTGAPDDKAQRNFTDAESRIMLAPGGRDFVEAYNCQAVVDSIYQVIVGGPGHQPDFGQAAGGGDQGVSIIQIRGVVAYGFPPSRESPMQVALSTTSNENRLRTGWRRSAIVIGALSPSGNLTPATTLEQQAVASLLWESAYTNLR